MNKKQILAVFERCGLGKMGEKLAFKLWIKGLGEVCDEDTLEHFLLAYGFQEDHSIRADDFMYHFQIYKNIIKRTDLPFQFF